MSVRDQIRSNWLVVVLFVILIVIIAVISGFLWYQSIELQKGYKTEIKRLKTIAEDANEKAAVRHAEIKLDLAQLRSNFDSLKIDYRNQQISFQNELQSIEKKHALELNRIHSLPIDSVARELSELFSKF